jgi:hypothetical protein
MSIFGPSHEYRVGDEAWIFGVGRGSDMTKGRVIAALELPGYSFKNYVIEIDTHIDPLLEIRSAMTMRPQDPRVESIRSYLLTEGIEVTVKQAIELLEVAEEK